LKRRAGKTGVEVVGRMQIFTNDHTQQIFFLKRKKVKSRQDQSKAVDAILDLPVHRAFFPYPPLPACSTWTTSGSEIFLCRRLVKATDGILLQFRPGDAL